MPGPSLPLPPRDNISQLLLAQLAAQFHYFPGLGGLDLTLVRALIWALTGRQIWQDDALEGYESGGCGELWAQETWQSCT